MDDIELKKLWQSYDQKLEEAKILNMQSWALNLHSQEILQAHKAKSKLASLRRLRVIEIIIHIVTLIYLMRFLFMHFFEIYFAIAAGILILFFGIAFFNCIRQIIIMRQINYTDNIVEIQQKLTLLQAHIIDYIRLTFLCIPTYLAYPIIGFKAFAGIDIIALFSGNWLMAQIIFSILLIPVCAWLYNQVSFKHIDKKWVKNIIEKSAGTAVSDAMRFVKEIDDFKKNI